MNLRGDAAPECSESDKWPSGRSKAPYGLLSSSFHMMAMFCFCVSVVDNELEKKMRVPSKVKKVRLSSKAEKKMQLRRTSAGMAKQHTISRRARLMFLSRSVGHVCSKGIRMHGTVAD